MGTSRESARESADHGRAFGPTTVRWTHIALPCADLDATLDWYARFTPLELLDQRDDADGRAAWIGHSDHGDHPFVLVLVSMDATAGEGPQPTLAPFAHLGIELPQREDVDDVARRGQAAGCLAWEPVDLPAPVGYVCALKDPDGNLVEFSHGQGVYAKAHEVWGGGRR